jgi:hypothetical protein
MATYLKYGERNFDNCGEKDEIWQERSFFLLITTLGAGFWKLNFIFMVKNHQIEVKKLDKTTEYQQLIIFM